MEDVTGFLTLTFGDAGHIADYAPDTWVYLGQPTDSFEFVDGTGVPHYIHPGHAIYLCIEGPRLSGVVGWTTPVLKVVRKETP